MEFIKKLLGIKKLENRISQNEKRITSLATQKKSKQQTPKQQAPKQQTPKQQPSKPTINATQTTIFQILKTPHSTTQVAKLLKISRSRTSLILNQLEKQNKIYEHSIKGKTILYKIIEP